MSEKATDIFSISLRANSLEAAVLTITSCLGLNGPEILATKFTAQDRITFGRLPNSYQQAEFLQGWLLRELHEAAERVGQHG